jgi:hypothetical protein
MMGVLKPSVHTPTIVFGGDRNWPESDPNTTFEDFLTAHASKPRVLQATSSLQSLRAQQKLLEGRARRHEAAAVHCAAREIVWRP